MINIEQACQTQSMKWAKYIEQFATWAAQKHLTKKKNIVYIIYVIIIIIYIYIYLNIRNDYIL